MCLSILLDCVCWKIVRQDGSTLKHVGRNKDTLVKVNKANCGTIIIALLVKWSNHFTHFSWWEIFDTLFFCFHYFYYKINFFTFLFHEKLSFDWISFVIFLIKTLVFNPIFSILLVLSSSTYLILTGNSAFCSYKITQKRVLHT